MEYAGKQKINRLLEQRHNEFPSRKGVYIALDRELKKFAESVLKETDLDYTPPSHIQESVEQLWHSPVFICGAKKSGTTMLLELLDGHKNLLTMPGDSFYVEKFLYGPERDYTFEELAKHWIYKLITPKGQEPFWFLGESEEKYKEFIQALYFYREKYEDPFRAVISAVYSVYYEKYRNAQYWVEKTPGNELYARKLAKKFPQAQFIHIQRDPFENIASLKKSRLARGNPFSVERAFYNVEYSRRVGERNQKNTGESQYLIVKYEDLLGNCEKEIQNIAEFLDIPFNDILCRPTSADKPTVSNSAHVRERVRGRVDKQKANHQKWKRELTRREQEKVVAFFRRGNLFQKVYLRALFAVYAALKRIKFLT